MINYIDVVLVKHPGNDNLYLFQAPSFSYLNEGDKVLCNTKKSPESEGVVAGVRTVENNSSELLFIAKACGATLPLKKIKSKIRITDLEYPDEESGTD